MNKFTRILPFVAAFAIVGTSVAQPAANNKAAALKAPKMPVAAAEKKGSFDITELKNGFQIEAGGTSKGGDVPVTPGLTSGGSKNGDVPVVSGLASNGSKNGDVPVVSGLMAGGKTGDVIVVTGADSDEYTPSAGGKTGDVVIMGVAGGGSTGDVVIISG